MWQDPKLFPAFLRIGLGCSVCNVCCDRIKAWPTVKQIFILIKISKHGECVVQCGNSFLHHLVSSRAGNEPSRSLKFHNHAPTSVFTRHN